MAGVLIDSNVLLDLMTEDKVWFAWSMAAIKRAADRHRLIINPAIYAEVSMRHSSLGGLDDALPKSFLDREPIPFEGAFPAAKAHQAYRRHGGERGATLPDFFIGAHEAVAGYELLTRGCRALPHPFSKAPADSADHAIAVIRVSHAATDLSIALSLDIGPGRRACAFDHGLRGNGM